MERNVEDPKVLLNLNGEVNKVSSELVNVPKLQDNRIQCQKMLVIEKERDKILYQNGRFQLGCFTAFLEVIEKES